MAPDDLLRYAFSLGTAIGLLVLFLVLQRLVAPWHDKSAAHVLVQAGHVAAVLLLVPGIVREALTHDTMGQRVLWAAAFGLAGVWLIQLVGEMGIRFLMGGNLHHELGTGNTAAGVAAGANYVAVGILAAPTIAGSDLHGLSLAFSFFALAVLTQSLYVILFRALTVYDDSEQIQGENMAAALSYAGVTLSVAIVLARALTGGDFPGWGPALRGYAGVALTALALYPVRQLIVQGLVLGKTPTLRGGALDQAIGVDRNVGLAALEALAYLATAVALYQLA